ncbi:metal-dependent transcriptional regulator [Candidatus Bathyarchaeota archaeon]|nr:metal-dependent transcriptional regulator [Candidatus Bathyarchaeota archaeon]
MDITRKEGEYLALVYRKQIENGERITTTGLARSLNVTPATVTESFQKLAAKDLIEYRPYHGIKLTKTGNTEAEKLLRRHRLLETLFVKMLKLTPKAACNEAARMDYYCSDELANHICGTYYHPIRCPCDKQIFGERSCIGCAQEGGS